MLTCMPAANPRLGTLAPKVGFPDPSHNSVRIQEVLTREMGQGSRCVLSLRPRFHVVRRASETGQSLNILNVRLFRRGRTRPKAEFWPKPLPHKLVNGTLRCVDTVRKRERGSWERRRGTMPGLFQTGPTQHLSHEMMRPGAERQETEALCRHSSIPSRVDQAASHTWARHEWPAGRAN